MKLAAFATGTLVAASLSTPVQATETILFNCFFPPRHHVCSEFLPEMGRRIDAATEGRVALRVPPSSLAAPPNQYEAVRNGVVDGAVQFNGFLGEQVPAIQFALLPFVGQAGAEQSSVAIWETYQAHFGPGFGDAVLLSVFAYNGGDFYSVTDAPIDSVQDIARRKIWAVPGATANTIAATGASVVSGPAVQMLEIVSRGVVDGHVGVPQSEIAQFKLTDYTRSVTLFPEKIFQASFSFFVSKDKWARISEPDRAAILAALGGDFARWMGAFQDRVFHQAHEELKAAGVAFVAGDPAMLDELRTLGRAQVEAWIARMGDEGVDGAQVLADYAAAVDAARPTNGD
ncbi:TRAP transporter substrate-binding protein DctP [Lutimaribacter degradans]|uniref:TRAP transporter substrate-binding protein DctP n=1 Tax=Lutimaribacter degradans TaxID=2945989 RepID=UPI002040BF6F|nr:TRAP transporter substrate-binding protein DctP [Lutimaribacter sp. EGI FJ00013]